MQGLSLVMPHCSLMRKLNTTGQIASESLLIERKLEIGNLTGAETFGDESIPGTSRTVRISKRHVDRRRYDFCYPTFLLRNKKRFRKSDIVQRLGYAVFIRGIGVRLPVSEIPFCFYFFPI